MFSKQAPGKKKKTVAAEPAPLGHDLAAYVASIGGLRQAAAEIEQEHAWGAMLLLERALSDPKCRGIEAYVRWSSAGVGHLGFMAFDDHSGYERMESVAAIAGEACQGDVEWAARVGWPYRDESLMEAAQTILEELAPGLRSRMCAVVVGKAKSSVRFLNGMEASRVAAALGVPDLAAKMEAKALARACPASESNGGPKARL